MDWKLEMVVVFSNPDGNEWAVQEKPAESRPQRQARSDLGGG